MSQLLYKTPYKNFELNIDVLYTGDSWISPIVGFGAQPGQFVTDADGVDAVFLGDGKTPHFWGTGIENVGRNDHANGFDYTRNFGDRQIANPTDWHHMRLVVQDSTIAMYIDDYEPYLATDFTYDGGYIFLAACHGTGRVKDMTIKALPERTAVIGETVEVPFNSAEDINKNFNSYYFNDSLSWLRHGQLGRKVNFSDVWKL